MTMTELLAKYNEIAAANGLPSRKGFDSKSKAEAAIESVLSSIKVKLQQAAESVSLGEGNGAKIKIKKSVRVHEKGPRGFKFGPVWLRSIVEGKGVALKPQNMPKLLDTAAFKGVQTSPDLSQAELAAAIAKAL